MTYTHEKITKSTMETVTDLAEVLETIKGATIDEMEGAHQIKVFIKPIEH